MTLRPRSAYIDGPFGQIHYTEEGIGAPVVLIHMAGFNGLQFQAALPLLAAAGYRAIAVDLPGFGRSTTPPKPPSVGDYTMAVAALLEGIGAEHAAVVGSHLGAEVATELAVTRPELVGKVILAGALTTTAEERAFGQAQVEAEKNITFAADGSHLAVMWRETTAFFAGWSNVDAMQRLVTSQLAAAEHNWYGHNAVFSYDHVAGLEKQTQPTLILTNTGDIAHSFSLRARDLFPTFEYVELEGGTALITDEQPEQWTAMIVDFLKK